MNNSMYCFLQTRYFVVVLLVPTTSEMMKRKPYFQSYYDKDLININFDPIYGLSIPNFIDKNNQNMRSDGVTPCRCAREKIFAFMQILIEACSTPSSRIVDLIVGTCINFYKLVFSCIFPPHISLQIFFSNVHHILYIIFLQSIFKVCFSQMLHFILAEHHVGISWGLRRTSLYSMMFLNPCWQAHLHLMQMCKILRMTMTIMRTLSSMNFVLKVVNNFIFIVYIVNHSFSSNTNYVSCFQNSSLCNFFLSLGFVDGPLSIFYTPPLIRKYGKSFII